MSDNSDKEGRKVYIVFRKVYGGDVVVAVYSNEDTANYVADGFRYGRVEEYDVIDDVIDDVVD